MGSLESGIPSKRDTTASAARSWGGRQQHPFSQRNRSKLSRFFLFKKFSYVHLICTMGVFFFFVVLFQMFLPGLVVVIDKSDKPPWRKKELLLPPDLVVFKERGVFDFGEDVRLEPTKLLMKFRRDSSDGFNLTSTQRFGFRKPKLALVTVLLLELFVVT